MSPPDRYSDADVALSDEAIDWLVRLNSGRTNDEDRLAFEAWRRRSLAHELAAQEAESVWHGLGHAGKQLRRERKNKLTRRAVIGGVTLVAGVAALNGSGLIGPHLYADYVSDVGEPRTVALADGSSVVLNGKSALSVDLEGSKRLLKLYSGQAVFTVAHDPRRPFIVEANGGQTRAIGTVFDVDIRTHEVVVTVLEGQIGVSSDTAPSKVVVASVDQRVRYSASTGPTAPEAVDSDVETAWRRGKLIFNGRPLGDVVAEIERHRNGRIVIANGDLRSLEVTGVFDLDQPDAILRTIEDTLPVRVTRLPLVTILR